MEELLITLQAWESGTDVVLQRYAKLLRLHYLYEMNWEAVGEDLKITKYTFYGLRDAALEKLREELM